MTALSCPICGSQDTERLLERVGVPIHQNSLIESESAARNVGRGDLLLALCKTCSFVFNAAFDASKLAYERDYDNTQNWSALFDGYVDGLVRSLVERHGVRGATVVEVGCGKGQFLRKLVEADPGNRGWGFDPSYVGEDQALGGRLQFRRELYGPAAAPMVPNVVVCRHVIEHVADPVALLKAVRTQIADHPDAQIFFETPSFEWIVDGTVLWDLFYEHCNYFTESALRRCFANAGYQLDSISRVFGDQYYWIVGRVGAPRNDGSAREIVEAARDFAARVRERENEWRDRIARLRQQGGLALWGAGAKGVTLANVVDPDRELIECVVDINPRKQGKFVAGTGHPIVAPSELGALGIRHVIVMNPNYRHEIDKEINGAPITVHAAEDR